MMIKLKNILTEGYAWERRANGSLPTLKDVQEAYDAKGKKLKIKRIKITMVMGK